MNKHSADATTAEEAIAIQSALDSDMATEVAMQDTLLTPRFYTTDFDELDAIDVSQISEEWEPLMERMRSDPNKGHFKKNEDWDNVINTNLSSVFNITKVFVKSMVKAREGRVINISSVAGLMGNPGQVNYSSSKAAIGGFTKSLAKELASRNITVNSIAPGFISSDMTDTLSDDQKSEILKQIPMQKFGDAKNIADLAVFLASDEGEYITGQTISVDGGLY